MICLDRTVPFVRMALEGTPEQAAEILRAAEQRHGLRWFASPINLEEDQRDEWYKVHLWPFLSETHLILSAGDLFATDCLLLDSAGIDHSPTWRHWGRIVADWANQHWMARPVGADRPWNYLDFYAYAYLSYHIEGYDTWRAAIWHILAVSGDGRVPVVAHTEPDRGGA